MRLARTLKTNSQAEFGTAAPPIHRHTDYSGLMPASLTIGPILRSPTQAAQRAPPAWRG